jgi:hypothetical protein
MANTDLFSRLQRLFSTDVVIRNVGGNNLKVIDSNQIQSSGKYKTNSLVDRFSRLYVYNNKFIFNPNLNYQTLRQQLYSDYEAMDTDAIIASSLDILCDEATLKNEYHEILTIKSPDENIKSVLNNLFYDVLNIEFNLWMWVRQMCKYGDHFLKLEIAEGFGVYNVIPYTVYNMAREEGYDNANPSSVRFILDPDGLLASLDPNYMPRTDRSKLYFQNYEIAHFRLLSDSTFLPYGRSYLEPARKIFKQLNLMEDAMLIHRIVRSPEKRIFYVNVGTIPPNEVEQFMQKTVTNMKKTPYVDPQTGQYNLKFNLQNMMEDFFIPVRGNDTATKIDTTPGLTYDGIQDINYLRDKLFAALKVPKAFFGYEKDLTGKATLAAEDIRFARTIERVQRIMESELTKIALVHLYAQGYEGEDLVNFDLKLSTSSIIYEQEKVMLMKERVELASAMMETKLVPSNWIYENIFNFSEDQYNAFRDQIQEDAKRTFRLVQIENEGNDPATTGKSFGTPHDLASLYNARNTGEDVPQGSDKDMREPGRPQEKATIYNTQEDPLGRDRLGVDDMKGKYQGEEDRLTENNRTKAIYYRYKDLFDSKKVVLFEDENKSGNLLDEKNIKDLED